MVDTSGSGKFDHPELPAEKKTDEQRKEVRKIIPDQPFSAVMVQPDGTYQLPRKLPRRELESPLKAHVLSAHDVNCDIRDISEAGLCILSMVNLEPKQKIAIFFQLPQWYIQETVGITLICEVVWHKPQARENPMAKATGLKVVSSTDDELFRDFVKKLPAPAPVQARA
jgi:hypothetical protein